MDGENFMENPMNKWDGLVVFPYFLETSISHYNYLEDHPIKWWITMASKSPKDRVSLVINGLVPPPPLAHLLYKGG